MPLNASALARRLPPRAKRLALSAARAIDVPLSAAFRARHRDVPVPPLRIRAQVAASLGPQPYVRGGLEVAQEIERILSGCGIEIDRARRALDLASGAGRVTVHLARRHPGVSFAACDVDDLSIGWLARSMPQVDARVSGFAPPLPFADGEFDLVLAISLWTHFDRPTEEVWLEELERVLAPGATALVTVLGAGSFGWHTESPDLRLSSADFMARLRATRGRLSRDGRVFVPYDRSADSAFAYRGVTGVYGLAFHAREYVQRVWGERFEVLGIVGESINRGQDAVLLRRRG